MKKLIFILSIIISYNIEAHNWNSRQFKGVGGMHLEVIEMEPYDGGPKTKKGKGPLLGWGIEKGWVSERHYIGVEAYFPYYKELFKQTMKYPPFVHPIMKKFNLPITFSGKMFLLWPIFRVHLGYIFDDGSLLTVGSGYLHAINVSYRRNLSPNFYWEVHTLWFLDRLTYSYGLHDLHLTFAVSYHF